MKYKSQQQTASTQGHICECSFVHLTEYLMCRSDNLRQQPAPVPELPQVPAEPRVHRGGQRQGRRGLRQDSVSADLPQQADIRLEGLLRGVQCE